MNLPERRSRQLLPDLTDWFESLPPMFGWRHMVDPHSFRIEDYIDDDTYVVRCELPGIDPEKDVEITVSDGMLTIKAERSEHKQDKHRSEFRYGSLYRSLQLPRGADEDQVTASYNDGILSVKVPLGAARKPARQISVQRS